MVRKFPIILVIDDSRAFRMFFKDIIKQTVKWVRVYEARDGLEGLKLYQQYKPDVILLDLRMPKIDGRKVLELIMKDNSNARIVVTTAYKDDQDTINKLIKMGAFSFLPKPMNRVTLMKTITDVLYDGKVAGTHTQIAKSFVLNQN